jgi:hypothetical protein
MKFNQWTLGLAAVGAVSLASAVRADEAKLSQVQTALSNTTISGYVDVGANWTAGNQSPRVAIFDNVGPQKTDNFSLNSVTISLDKPQDETPWAAGYHVDLNAGTDAINGFNNGSFGGTSAQSISDGLGTFSVRQAYIALRTPVGNGIDWKVGVIDGITGYEGNTSYANPNYSRSYGYAVNPASYTGILGTYKFTSLISLTAGFINRNLAFATIGQSNSNLSSHDYVASLSLTAPDSWGFLKGSTLNAQTVQGFDNQSVNNYSLNGTLNTPVAGLTVGFAWDSVQSLVSSVDGNIYGVYASYQATDKLNLALRGEYLDTTDLNIIGFATGKGEELTGTVTYNLWANVVTRAEVRWDHIEHFTAFNSFNSELENQISFALNLVYKF